MIVIFFIGCIFLGILIAPIAVIVVKSKNNKIIKRLKSIKSELITIKSLDSAKTLRNEATDLILKLLKPDIKGHKEAEMLIGDIKELVTEIK